MENLEAMTPSMQYIHEELSIFLTRCAENLRGMEGDEACIRYAREKLPELLLQRELFVGLLKDTLEGKSFLDVKRPTMFDNELLMYLDASGLFSLRMYLWGPGEYTVPHDHSSWGVIGSLTDGYEVINYRREDDGSVEGYARLSERDRFILRAGETAYTFPLDAGIHKTGNPTMETLVSLNLYGRPLPRGYLCGFDPEHDRVYRMLPPRRKKEHLLKEALRNLR